MVGFSEDSPNPNDVRVKEAVKLAANHFRDEINDLLAHAADLKRIRASFALDYRKFCDSYPGTSREEWLRIAETLKPNDVIDVAEETNPRHPVTQFALDMNYQSGVLAERRKTFKKLQDEFIDKLGDFLSEKYRPEFILEVSHDLIAQVNRQLDDIPTPVVSTGELHHQKEPPQQHL